MRCVICVTFFSHPCGDYSYHGHQNYGLQFNKSLPSSAAAVFGCCFFKISACTLKFHSFRPRNGPQWHSGHLWMNFPGWAACEIPTLCLDSTVSLLKLQSVKNTYNACSAVAYRLHFGQNKRSHINNMGIKWKLKFKKLTLEKKSLLPGIKPVTFWSWIRCSGAELYPCECE